MHKFVKEWATTLIIDIFLDSRRASIYIQLRTGELYTNNTFACVWNIIKLIRLWAGPLPMIGFYSGETDEAFLSESVICTGAGFKSGTVMGAKFGFGSEKVILTTTLGLRSIGPAEDTEWVDESGSATEIIFSYGIKI